VDLVEDVKLAIGAVSILFHMMEDKLGDKLWQDPFMFIQPVKYLHMQLCDYFTCFIIGKALVNFTIT
jgi:hypothetical protein